MSKRKIHGGVYDRGSAWQVRIKRTDAGGNLHRINRTFPYDPAAPSKHPHSQAAVKKRAEAFAAVERAALHVEKRPASDLLEAQNLGVWLERYAIEICPHKKGGANDARQVRLIRHRFPALCNRPVSTLTSMDFGMNTPSGIGKVLDQQYLLEPATIRRALAVLSHVFTVARKEWGFPVANPVMNATKPKVSNARERVVSDQEWAAIQKAMAGAASATRAAIEFLRWTACRRGEAIKLRWEDVRLEGEPVALLRDTKTPKEGEILNRTIPLHDEGAAVLRSLLGGTSPPARGPVFVLSEGQAVQPDSLTQAWERACAKAGVKDATLQDLRHTRITELANLLPMQKVMRITGHRTPAMLLRYYNPKAEDLGQDVREAALAKQTRRRKVDG